MERRKEVERRKDRNRSKRRKGRGRGKGEGRPSLSLKVLEGSFSFPSFNGDCIVALRTRDSGLVSVVTAPSPVSSRPFLFRVCVQISLDAEKHQFLDSTHTKAFILT